MALARILVLLAAVLALAGAHRHELPSAGSSLPAIASNSLYAPTDDLGEGRVKIGSSPTPLLVAAPLSIAEVPSLAPIVLTCHPLATSGTLVIGLAYPYSSTVSGLSPPPIV